MKTRYVILLTSVAAAIAAATPLMADAAPPPPGGMLATMPHGTYQCALPGDALGDAFVVMEDEQFVIGTASSYRSAKGRGTYILRGETLTFTRGPRKGESFKRVGTNQLKRGDLLCTRLGSSG